MLFKWGFSLSLQNCTHMKSLVAFFDTLQMHIKMRVVRNNNGMHAAFENGCLLFLAFAKINRRRSIAFGKAYVIEAKRRL